MGGPCAPRAVKRTSLGWPRAERPAHLVARREAVLCPREGSPLWLGLALLAAAFAPFAARAQHWAPNITTTATWQSNATNADRDTDILAAVQLHSAFAVARRFALGGSDALRLGGQLTAEAWPRYDGLDRGAVGIRAGWTHKFGLGALAPTLALELAGDAFGARENGRAGRAGSATVLLQQRLDDNWRLALAYERARYDARQHAFDRTGEETSARADYDFDARWRLSATARLRHGGVLSYATPPRPDLLTAGKALTTVTTFDRNRPMVAYYFIARTVSGEAAVSRALDDATALNFAYEFRETEKGAIRYVNHLVSLGVTRQF
jgi:hypothetical protein